MAKELTDILEAAAVVRDETAAQQNTAERVGGILCDLTAFLQNKTAITGLDVRTDMNGVSIRVRAQQGDGQEAETILIFPEATEKQSGIITSVLLQQLRAGIAAAEGAITTAEESMRQRLLGNSKESSAYTDPFISLGESTDWMEFSAKLDGLSEKKYMGRCRATVSGVTVEVYQFINSFSASNYTQVILGNVSAGDNGQVRFTPNNFNIIHRQHKDGSWSAWQRINDHPLATSSLDGLMSASDKAALDAAKSDIASLQSSKADKAALDIQLNIVSNIATSAQMKSTGNAADIATLKGRVSGLEEVAVKIGRSVAIGEIGSLFTSDLPSVQSGDHCGLWQVKSGNYIIGVLEVFVDGMYHCISQKLTTNCTVNADGKIDDNGH